MLIFKQHRIYRKDLKDNPHILYIFGDNLDREGNGGQAGEMRGSRNAFGIATKRSISHSYPDDYFFDTQTDVLDILKSEFDHLRAYLKESGYHGLCIPSDGIGTGLSMMPDYAPKALTYIEEQFKLLEEDFGSYN